MYKQAKKDSKMSVGYKYNFLLKALIHKGFRLRVDACRSENMNKVDWTIALSRYTFVLSNKKALQGLLTVPGIRD